MKKIILFVLFIGLNLNLIADSPSYQTKMMEAIDAMNSSTTADDFKKSANTFDRIAKVETKEWLPLYYSANIKVLLIYIDTEADNAQKDAYLDQADKLIAQMEEITENKEAEVYCLKAFSIISRISVDAQTRGQSMYSGYEVALSKAIQLDLKNPRVQYMQLSSQVGQAQWFGQSIEPFCGKMKELYDTWDSYPPVSEIHPSWGKDQLLQIMQPCN